MYLRKWAEWSDLQPAAELVPVEHLSRLQHKLSSSVVESLMNHPAANKGDTANWARVQPLSLWHRKQACAHVNPNALTLTLCFYFFIQLWCDFPPVLQQECPTLDTAPTLCGPFISSTHTCTQTQNLTHQQQVFFTSFSSITAKPSLLPEAPGNHHSHSITGIIANPKDRTNMFTLCADYMIPNSFICKSD